MSDPVVTDEAVRAALDALQSPQEQDWADAQGVAERGMRRALTAALPHLVAERDARVKALEAAAQGLIDGAFGNGSRITVSKTDYDRLVDALSISRMGKPHE